MRWGRVCQDALCAAWVVFVGEYVLEWRSFHLIDQLANLGTNAVIAVFLIGTVVFAILNGAIGRWAAWLGVRHPVRYPGPTITICAAAVLIGILDEMVGSGRIVREATAESAALLTENADIAAGVLPGVAIALAAIRVICQRLPLHDPEPEQPPNSGPHAPLTLQQLLDWCRCDMEIRESTQDLFGLDPIAERIANRIQNAVSGGDSSIAVVGPFGSGKSSLANLVAWRLSRARSIRFVRVSAWGYETIDAACVGLLRELVHEISKEVNALPLWRIEHAYVEAISTAGGPWSVIGQLLRVSAKPAQILEELNAIAKALNTRMLLWIEDLDRFFESFQSTSPANSNAPNELGPLQALLYHLDRCSSICVIIADTSLEHQFDVQKIARFVEWMPTVERPFLREVLSSVVDHCLSESFMQIVYCRPSQLRTDFEKPESPAIVRSLGAKDPAEPASVLDAIATLAQTPRAIKTVLRRTLEIWEALKGEIHFDDVLIATTIRETQPQIFQFIDSRRDAIACGFSTVADDIRKRSHRKSEEVLGRCRQEWDDLLLKLSRDEANAVRVLSQLLFPDMNGKRLPHWDYSNERQSVASLSPADYWRRYMNQGPVPFRESDQRALREAKRWIDGEPQNLVEWCIGDPDFAERVQVLCSMPFEPALCFFYECCKDGEAKEPRRNWTTLLEPPAWFTAAYFLLARSSNRCDNAVVTKILQLVSVLAQRNLAIVSLIIRSVDNEVNRNSGLFGREHSQPIRDEAKQLLAAIVNKNDVDRFVSALRDTDSYTLIRFLEDVIPQGAQGDFLATDPIPGLGSFLMAAAQHCPTTIVPQLVGVLCDIRLMPPTANEINQRPWYATVIPNRANWIGGSALEPVFSNCECSDGDRPEVAEGVRAIRDWLAANR